MSLISHEEIGHARRGSSRGCHEDATRKMVPWNLSLNDDDDDNNDDGEVD